MAKQIYSIRIEKDALESIKKEAENEGKTQSSYMRERLHGDPIILDKLNQILNEVKKDGEGKQKK